MDGYGSPPATNSSTNTTATTFTVPANSSTNSTPANSTPANSTKTNSTATNSTKTNSTATNSTKTNSTPANSSMTSSTNATRKNSTQAGGAMKTVGSKAMVYHGKAKHTSGGLTRKDLMKTKKGRIVSRKKHAAGKKALKRLVKAGYKAKRGTFKLFKK